MLRIFLLPLVAVALLGSMQISSAQAWEFDPHGVKIGVDIAADNAKNLAATKRFVDEDNAANPNTPPLRPRIKLERFEYPKSKTTFEKVKNAPKTFVCWVGNCFVDWANSR